MLQKWKPIDGIFKFFPYDDDRCLDHGRMDVLGDARREAEMVDCSRIPLHFLCLLYVILRISDRMTDLSHNAQYFKSLRLNFERFIYDMEVNPDFPLEPFKTTFEQYPRMVVGRFANAEG